MELMGDDHDHMLNIDAVEEDLKLGGEGDNAHDYDTRSEASTVSSVQGKSTSLSPVRQAKTAGRQYDYITKLNYLFRDTRFFVIKSNNEENIALSKARGVWSTLPANESKLNQAYEECRNVLLVFSGRETGKFAGFARLAEKSRRDVSPVPWVLPPGMSARNLSSVFKVDWICRRDLPFAATTHLLNEWNDMKPIKIGRDGQEMEPKAAEALLRLFPEDEGIDMTPILRKSKKASHKTKLRSGKMHERRQSPPRRSGYRPVLPRSRFRLPVIDSKSRGDMPRMRRAEELAYMHGLPPLPFGPPGMYPPSGFDHLMMLPPAPPRYYDGVPPTPLMPPSFIAAHEKRSYDRSVDEFLYRTRARDSRSRSGERERDRYDRKGRERAHSHSPVRSNGRSRDHDRRDGRDKDRRDERSRDRRDERVRDRRDERERDRRVESVRDRNRYRSRSRSRGRDDRRKDHRRR